MNTYRLAWGAIVITVWVMGLHLLITGRVLP